MNPTAFIDTNILIRVVTNDIPDQAGRSHQLMREIATGARTVRLTDSVIVEAVVVLTREYKVPREHVRDALLPLIALPHMVLPDKEVHPEAFERWVREPSLSFADSYHLSLAKHLGLTEIISFDRKLGKDPAVRRLEP